MNSNLKYNSVIKWILLLHDWTFSHPVFSALIVLHGFQWNIPSMHCSSESIISLRRWQRSGCCESNRITWETFSLHHAALSLVSSSTVNVLLTASRSGDIIVTADLQCLLQTLAPRSQTGRQMRRREIRREVRWEGVKSDGKSDWKSGGKSGRKVGRKSDGNSGGKVGSQAGSQAGR